MKMSLIVAVLGLAACSHHTDSPLPRPPKGSGITLAADGDDTIVTDTIGGYQLRIPGRPSSITDDPMVSDGVAHPAISIQEDGGASALMVGMIRFRPGELRDRETQAVFLDGMTEGGDIVERSEITVAGQPARVARRRVDAKDERGRAREWAVYTPEHAVVYVVVINGGADRAPTRFDHVIDSLRRVGP